MTCSVMLRKLNIQYINQPKMFKVMSSQLNPSLFGGYSWHLIPA